MTETETSVDSAARTSSAGSGRTLWHVLGRMPRGFAAVMRYFVAPLVGGDSGARRPVRDLFDDSQHGRRRCGHRVPQRSRHPGLGGRSSGSRSNAGSTSSSTTPARRGAQRARIRVAASSSPPGVLIWLFVAHRHRYRLMSSVLVLTTGFALVGFYSMPTAPPRMLADERFVDIMAKTGSWGWWRVRRPGSDAVSTSSPRCRRCTAPGPPGAA